MRQAVRPNLKRLAAIQDPMWPDMWYLNRHSINSDLPDMNETGAWSQGYSGRGVSVTFLDDGLEHDHPDIKQNYDANASDDINGIIALTLEANSKLTWRDIMYLIVLTSRPKAIKSNNFIVNQRGFLVSSRYGFGLMDAGRMVELAKNWQNVPTLRSCQTINSNFKINTVQKVDALEAVLSTDACFGTDSEVNFIEQVEIVVSIQAPVRGNLEMYLTSPMGTRSLILPKRPKDQSGEGFKRWPFMTVQLWGEMAQGEWKLVVASSDQMVRLEDFNLIIHGTKEKPIEYENLLNMRSVIDLKISEESNKPVLDSMSVIKSKLNYITKQIQSMFNGINNRNTFDRT